MMRIERLSVHSLSHSILRDGEEFWRNPIAIPDFRLRMLAGIHVLRTAVKIHALFDSCQFKSTRVMVIIGTLALLRFVTL